MPRPSKPQKHNFQVLYTKSIIKTAQKRENFHKLPWLRNLLLSILLISSMTWWFNWKPLILWSLSLCCAQGLKTCLMKDKKIVFFHWFLHCDYFHPPNWLWRDEDIMPRENSFLSITIHFIAIDNSSLMSNIAVVIAVGICLLARNVYVWLFKNSSTESWNNKH